LRIQTSEMLATPDAEMVLRVLEWSLRDVSIEVVRDGRRITVRGLGPSQRTMNRNDIALVEVANENQHTVIRADITYQASALLGGTPQDDLVRSKLDRVLERVKMELRTQSVRMEAVSWFTDPGRTPEYMMEPDYALEERGAVETGRGLEPKVGTSEQSEPLRAAERVVETWPARAVDPVVAIEPVREREPEVVPDRGASATLPLAAETVPVGGAAEKPAPVVTSNAPEKRVEAPMFQTFHPEEETKTPKRWGLLATVACMLVAVGLFLAWPYLAGLVHERLNPSSTVVDDGPAVGSPEAAKLAADQTPIQSDANVMAARSAAIHNESEPKIWRESWADAMRGQDASAQALFYADPVEHYALKSNVSNADVWLDKKNAIQGRPKVWTVNLEDVVIEPRPDESLRVRLTKHYTTAPSNGGTVSEQFVHSQLKLRKIDGQWKITSEQNLRQ
jgi:ketosteroid isomerase-like protein